MDNLTSPDHIVNSVQKFILHRDFHKGHTFIRSIDKELTSLPAIALICGKFYYILGYPRLADESLNCSEYESLIVDHTGLLEEEIACIALLAAQVRIRRYFDYENAWALLKKVEQIYIKLEAPEAISDTHTAQHELIVCQSYLWEATEPEIFDDKETPISDTRVFIEVSMIELMRTGVEGGFMLEAEFSPKVKARIVPLISFLRARKRRYLENICFCLLDDYYIWPTVLERTEFITKYHAALIEDGETGDEEALAIYRGIALSRIAQAHIKNSTIALSPDFVKVFFTESRKQMEGVNCLSRLADWDFIRLRDFEKAPGSNATRIDQLIEVQDRYKALGNTDAQIDNIRLILRIGEDNISVLWKKMESTFQYLEEQLESVDDKLRLLVTRIVKYRAIAWNLQYTESCRRFLAAALHEHPEQLTPDLRPAVCEGLFISYYSLGDYDLCVKYAEMEVNSHIPSLPKDRLSDAEYRLATAKEKQITKQLEEIDNDLEQLPKRQELIKSLLGAAQRLEPWFEWDDQNGRKEPRRDKANELVIIYNRLDKTFCPNQGYENKVKIWVEASQLDPDASPSRNLVSICAHVMSLNGLKKHQEAYEYAETNTRAILASPTEPAQYKGVARMLIILTMQGILRSSNSHAPEKIKEWRARQFQWLLQDTKLLFQEDQASEMLLARATVLCWVVKESVKLFPDFRTRSLEFMAEYFLRTDKMCYNLRHSLKEEASINQLLRKRMINSKYLIKTFYNNATNFFLQVGNETRAWYWMQRKRGRALIDLLADRAAAYDQFQLALEKNKEISPLLKEEESLVENVTKAPPGESASAVEDLAQLRGKLKRVPTLTGILEEDKLPKPDDWSNLDDIWSLSEYLAKDTNIILVDWFVQLDEQIYWMTKNFKEKDLTPRWKSLSIKPVNVQKWIAKYLQFPTGKKCRLEKEPKALWSLQALLSGLEIVCKPGDLVILTPPALLATIPLHAIPFENKPWIEQNTIIYSSSFSLYRECLKRSKIGSSDLTESVFTAVYEEAESEQERDLIMDQVSESALVLGGRKVLGTELTKESMQEALTSSPWVHYHGHAYFERSEALRQCFVLSKGLNSESPGLAEGGNSDDKSSSLNEDLKSLSLLEPLKPQTSASTLLENSSQLTVSDIFTLNLSPHHPFICTIACHSGIQDIGAGDEPLGLVTALFCAGASSVLGTLWPIRSDMGRLFTREFYRAVGEQKVKNEGGGGGEARNVLNLALAVREAVLEVKKVGRDPYCWAAFVLHGVGFYLYE